MITINARIAIIRNHFCNGSNNEFADKLNISKEYAYNITKTGEEVDKKIIAKILSVFPEVSKDWLIKGKNNMLEELNDNTEQNEDLALQSLRKKIIVEIIRKRAANPTKDYDLSEIEECELICLYITGKVAVDIHKIVNYISKNYLTA
jgi:hypothetical protein